MRRILIAAALFALALQAQSNAGADADAAKFAELDQLIQSKAEVPLAELEPLIDKFPTDVLILAARSHEDASGLLLKLLERQHNREAFTAIGDLLTPQRNAGFAKAAMKEFCQSATVYVYSPGQPQGMGSGWAGDNIGKDDPMRPDLPDVGSYRLYPGTGNRRQAWTLFADGPHPVSYARTVGKSYGDHGFDHQGEDSNNNSCIRAEEFLAMYLKTAPPVLPIRASAKIDLVWTTPEAFESAVRNFIVQQRIRYGVLANRLVAHGYLTPDEAAKATLNLRINANDVRQSGRTPLPNLNDWAK